MAAQQGYEVDLPAGGTLHLQSADEVELWRKSAGRYVEDYHLTKLNDLVLLGGILQQQIVMFRAQRQINGMEPELDDQGIPTGKWVQMDIKPEDQQAAVKSMTAATEQITTLEKKLGIDKVSRESGGQHTLSNYLATLKKAAHERGIHISKRTLEYEKFVNGLRWRIRLLLAGDDEDKAYHDLTFEKVIAWADGELSHLEQVDKDFARDRGKLYIGKL